MLTLETIRHALILYFILLISLTLHEWAHAFAANYFGDPTPRLQGRITLNPFAHTDPLGTVFLPLFTLLFTPSFMIIGWGKPVMIDNRFFKKKKFHDICVSLAGPLINILIALITICLGGVGVIFNPAFGGLLGYVVWINISLAIFNFLPIPPLDGSHVLKHAVNMSESTFNQFSQWGFVILIVLINIPYFQNILLSTIGISFSAIIYIGSLIYNLPIESFLPHGI
jgi:Zn-dependent protease